MLYRVNQNPINPLTIDGSLRYYENLKYSDTYKQELRGLFSTKWFIEMIPTINSQNRECLEFRLSSECTTESKSLREFEVEADVVVEFQGAPCLRRASKYNGGCTKIAEYLKEDLFNGRSDFFKINICVKKLMGFLIHCNSYTSLSDSVQLNIGGETFRTTEPTLSKFDGFLKFLYHLEPSLYTPSNQKEKLIFIDRSPKHFDLILNFMRDGDVILPESEREIREILKEAEYYWMPSLHNLCLKRLETKKPVNEVVKLDIGGMVFKTTKTTLTRFDGMFKTMLENDILIKNNNSESIFIDRSPKHFDLILNYMRDGDVELPENPKELREIIREAQYYLLPDLAKACASYFDIVEEN